MPFTVPKAAVEEMSRQLGIVGEGAQGLMRRFLESVRGINGAPLADASVQAMEQICTVSCMQAAAIAADFYDAEREMTLGAPLGAVADPRRSQASTEEAVRGIAQKAMDGNRAAFENAMLERVDYETKRAAQNCTVYNGSVDTAKPRYARVTMGDSCDFCLMLASQGFVYHSEAAAVDHTHANCTCVAVAGFDGKDSRVEGYDSKEVYDQWEQSIMDRARERAERKGTDPDDEYAEYRSWWNQHRRGAKKPTSGATKVAQAAAQAVDGFESVGDISAFVRAATSLEDLDERMQRAQLALDSIIPSGASGRESAISAIRQSAKTARRNL